MSNIVDYSRLFLSTLKIILWVFFALSSLIVFGVSQWEGYSLHQLDCGNAVKLCENFFQLTSDQVKDLEGLGLSTSFFSGVLNGLLGSQFLSFFLVSVLLFMYGRKDWICYFASILLLCAGVDYSTDEFTAMLYPEVLKLYQLEQIVFGFSFFFFFLYPDMRFFPSWMMYPAGIIFVLMVSPFLFPGTILDMTTWPVWARGLHYVTFNSLLIYSQVKRYRTYYSKEQKRRTHWFLLSISCFVLGALSAVFLEHALLKLLYLSIMYIGLMFLPFTIGISVMEHRFKNTSFMFNRSIVYVVLSIFIVAAFALITGTLGAIFPSNNNVMISMVTTALIAILFHPIREKVQIAVNKLIYGEREEPYKVISSLVQRLEDVISNRSVLPETIKVAAKALDLPYAAVRGNGNTPIILASYGEKPNEISEIPLSIQGNWIGTLILGTADLDNSLPPTKQYLLDDLIRQVAIAVQTALTADELQLSRQRLVSAREEERRRLRRDLHDGLGASLASMSLRLDAAIHLMEKDIYQSKEMLSHIQSNLDQSISDIRTLVYALRPPALDEFGLMFALRELTKNYSGIKMKVSIIGPERLPSLHAATEAAAYRIVQEAINNAVRHSGGTECVVTIFKKENHLVLQVEDNGIGIPVTKTAGIGLRSIRERAEELGGNCSFNPRNNGGTIISINLPLWNPNKQVGENE